jgi:hypothetical protein
MHGKEKQNEMGYFSHLLGIQESVDCVVHVLISPIYSRRSLWCHVEKGHDGECDPLSLSSITVLHEIIRFKMESERRNSWLTYF